jgi:hypothetical protein
VSNEAGSDDYDYAGIEAARKFLQYVRHAHNLFEIRGLGAPAPWGTMSGLFDNAVAASRAAALMSGRGANVYYSLNVVETPLAATNTRLNGMYTNARVTTKDRDIWCRANLLIDCDPVRAEEFDKFCATDEEKSHAFDLLGRARAIMDVFFPGLRPVVIDSGNGYQALYRCITSKGDDEATQMVSNLLNYLGDVLDTDKAKVDRSVFNLARIARLPGFMNRRGPAGSVQVALPDRPHRRAKVLEYPHSGPNTAGQYFDWFITAEHLRARGFGGGDPDPEVIAKFQAPPWWEGMARLGKILSGELPLWTPAPPAPPALAFQPPQPTITKPPWPPALEKPAAMPLTLPVSVSKPRSALTGDRRPFIATLEEVRRFIADYPEHLHLVRESRDGEVMYFALRSCPFKGGPHRDMDVGTGKVTIQLWPQNMGFNCYSDDHAHLKFYDLYQWLIQETGRRTTAKLWGPLPEPSREELDRINRFWGGIDMV